MIKIAFIVCEMTFFRHFLPIVKAIKGLELETKIYFLIEKNHTQKYSSIERNVHSFNNILKSTEDITFLDDSFEGYDIIFTVEEVCGRFKKSAELSKRKYSLQYFFDYMGNLNSGLDFTKIVYDKIYKEDIKKYSNKSVIVSPTPPSLFFANDFIEYGLKKVGDKNHSQKHVTIFYPENGNNSLLEKIIIDLKEKNFKIHIKQRRKHQTIPEKLKIYANVYYDDDWYPSECYYLPVISNFCIGFGTSAYCELSKIGLNFLDIPLTKDSRSFLKPENLYVLDASQNEEEKIKNWVSEKSLMLEYKKPVINNEDVLDFIKSLLV